MKTFTVIVNDHPGDLLVYRGIPEGPTVEAARASKSAVVLPEAR